MTLPIKEQFQFECLMQPQAEAAPRLRAFFRRIGLAHVFDEMLWPGLESGAGMAVMAVRDRPWPPWGIGARAVSALTFIHPVGEGVAGLSNVFAVPEEESSIGLLAAVYREGLDQLAQRGSHRVHLVAREQTFMAGRILDGAGFQRTAHVHITDAARYYLHEAELDAHVAALGISGLTPLQLLAEEIPGHAFERLTAYLLTLNLTLMGYWREVVRGPELIPNTGMAEVPECLPPAGPPG